VIFIEPADGDSASLGSDSRPGSTDDSLAGVGAVQPSCTSTSVGLPMAACAPPESPRVLPVVDPVAGSDCLLPAATVGHAQSSTLALAAFTGIELHVAQPTRRDVWL
jgi:hypothetical protein